MSYAPSEPAAFCGPARRRIRHSPAIDRYILTMMLRIWRLAAYRKALAILALVIHGASVGAAEPDRIFLRFEVSGGPAAGLHFLTLTATVDQSHQGYAVAAEAKTRGLADLFLALRSRLDVRGRIFRRRVQGDEGR